MTPTYQNIGFSEMQLAEQNGIGRFEDDYHRFLMEHGKIDRFDLHHQSDLFRQSPTSHLYDMCQCSESDLDLEFYSSEWITQNALSQIDAWDPKQPELLMVGYINPHHPFDPPAPYSTMYNPDIFCPAIWISQFLLIHRLTERRLIIRLSQNQKCVLLWLPTTE